MSRHTRGPWAWLTDSMGRTALATPDRGRLYVMDFARRGMQGAQPRFSQWQGIMDGADRARAGGIMEDGIWLPDGTLHPDARVIAAAPRLLELAYQFASECADCAGTRVRPDRSHCHECDDIWSVIELADGPSHAAKRSVRG